MCADPKAPPPDDPARKTHTACNFNQTMPEIRRSHVLRTPVLKACLELVQEGQKQSYPLSDKPIVLGRSDECDIQIICTNASRQHARVHSVDDEYILEDLDSTNGTFINGVRVASGTLRNNDQITIGSVTIIFTEERGE